MEHPCQFTEQHGMCQVTIFKSSCKKLVPGCWVKYRQLPASGSFRQHVGCRSTAPSLALQQG